MKLKERKSKRKEEREQEEDWKKTKDIIDKIFRETKVRREKMTDFVNAYRNNIWKEDKLAAWESRATYNIFFSTVSSLAPLITDSKPNAVVVPKVPYMERPARAYTEAVKYFWDVADMPNILYKWAVWTQICGIGVVKAYYCTIKKRFTVELVDPRDFFIAPGYETISEAPYCGTKSKRPVSWVKEVFPDVDLKASITSYDAENDKEKSYKYSDVNSIESESLFVTVYEFWCRDTAVIEGEDGEEIPKFPYGKLTYFTEDDFLGELEAPDNIDGAPYVEIMDYYNPGMFTGIGEGDLLLDLNKEMNLQLQRVVDAARTKKNYVAASNAGLDPDQLKSDFFKGGQVFMADIRPGQSVPIMGVDVDQPSKEVYMLLEMIPDIAEDVTGVTETTKGIAGKKERQSAVEVAVLAEASNTRIRQKIRNLESGIKRLCYIMVRIMQQYSLEPVYVQTDDDKDKVYTEFSSTREAVGDMIAPESMRKKVGDTKIDTDWVDLFEQSLELPENNGKFLPEELARMKDYTEYVKALSGESMADPVYFGFDIEIQTGSTLPLDKQSQANMMLQLAKMNKVDTQSLLEVLQVPGYKEIIQRMKAEKAAQPPKGAKK